MFLVSILQLSLPQSIEVENEDLVEAAPTGDAPTTSEWSTISLPTTGHIRGLRVKNEIDTAYPQNNRWVADIYIHSYHISIHMYIIFF